ncbi:MAG TPA: hypothetical protein VG248_05610 [Caulobacteraceae bacterium]|jgi:hypothetical protein|nr:hypothetical protein [Caulobacteraceae bacterium]
MAQLPAGESSVPPARWFGIIDGTGPSSDGDYAHAMEGGFCSQIWNQYASGPSGNYQRGPSGSGSGLANAVNAILTDMAALPDETKIVLVGYSRGALGCVMAARSLKSSQPQKTIEAALLFDPVDRYLAGGWGSGNPVPPNVRHSFRLFRSYGKVLEKAFDGTMSDFGYGMNRIAKANPFRPSFGNTALDVEPGPGFAWKNHETRSYICSHGAMGGVGYRWVNWGGGSDLAAEADICRDVKRWFGQTLGIHHLALKPGLDPDNGTQELSPFFDGRPRRPGDPRVLAVLSGP